jgi:hypothetical protein
MCLAVGFVARSYLSPLVSLHSSTSGIHALLVMEPVVVIMEVMTRKKFQI